MVTYQMHLFIAIIVGIDLTTGAAMPTVEHRAAEDAEEVVNTSWSRSRTTMPTTLVRRSGTCWEFVRSGKPGLPMETSCVW